MSFERVKNLLHDKSLLGIYQLAGGLSEFWAAVFAICAIILAFKGKLDSNFAAAITAITGILAAHDALDDYHTRCIREGKQEETTREGDNGIPATDRRGKQNLP